MSTEQKLYTQQEVADAVDVSVAMVRKWTKEKRIPSIRISSQLIRYDLPEVIEALKQTSEDKESA